MQNGVKLRPSGGFADRSPDFGGLTSATAVWEHPKCTGISGDLRHHGGAQNIWKIKASTSWKFSQVTSVSRGFILFHFLILHEKPELALSKIETTCLFGGLTPACDWVSDRWMVVIPAPWWMTYTVSALTPALPKNVRFNSARNARAAVGSFASAPTGRRADCPGRCAAPTLSPP